MRALVSVYDKSGLIDFVLGLVGEGYEIVSSGGTAAALADAGIQVTRVSDVTGAPEMLGGRVKTLHPKIHAGILARGEADDAELAEQGIARFDLVVCNLYPFRETLAAETDIERIVEMIDIGGPAMVRAAAKNHRHVGVVVSPSQYEEVGAAVREGGLDQDLRRRLAAEAFFHTASYDAAIVGWMGDDRVLPLRAAGDLRYGENPHQKAQIYREDGANPWWRVAVQHQGAEMSFNNYLDAEAAWRLATALGANSAVVVKHTNPCGAALGATALEAFTAAWHGDPLAAFGGVVALGTELDAETAAELAPRFVEIVIAPSVSRAALEILEPKKRLRVLTAPAPKPGVDYRRVEGGFLAQEEDSPASEVWEVVSDRTPTPGEEEALRFAWTVAAHAKSNAIVLANGPVAVGVGAGDQSRVGAGERAVTKAGERSKGAVAASDAFFPFRDGVDVLADHGVTAVIQPGGSRNDAEVLEAANQHGMAMVFTGARHFRH
jgi:phosphoribosylaminoimidazolecarboxamide formyltransferase / IMP cyclohydrolase